MTEIDTDIDAPELESYLSERGVVASEIEILSDGLNLNLAISTAEGGRTYVLRRPNKLRHTDLFNELRSEYRLMKRLQETPLPVPTPVLFCDDDSILDGSFFVMAYLEGEAIPLGTDLPKRFRNAESRRGVATLLVDTLAEIHTVAVEPLEEVCGRQTPREGVDRAIGRLDDATNVTGHELPTLRSVGSWLQQNEPASSKTTLVHGDFRPGNVLFAGVEQPEITGVLDWETAVLGDPLTELGYLLLRWRDEGDPTPSLDALEARDSNEAVLQQLRETNENGLAPFTTKPGSPSRRELVARYENETGISFENERFYRAHAAFMLATVWVDLHRHQVEAGAKSDWEPHIEYMTMIADSIVNGNFDL